MWDLQRKVPAVHLYGNVVLSPNDFLARKLPAAVKVLDKKTLDHAAVTRDHLARLDGAIAK